MLFVRRICYKYRAINHLRERGEGHVSCISRRTYILGKNTLDLANYDCVVHPKASVTMIGGDNVLNATIDWMHLHTVCNGICHFWFEPIYSLSSLSSAFIRLFINECLRTRSYLIENVLLFAKQIRFCLSLSITYSTDVSRD